MSMKYQALTCITCECQVLTVCICVAGWENIILSVTQCIILEIQNLSFDSNDSSLKIIFKQKTFDHDNNKNWLRTTCTKLCMCSIVCIWKSQKKIKFLQKYSYLKKNVSLLFIFKLLRV